MQNPIYWLTVNLTGLPLICSSLKAKTTGTTAAANTLSKRNIPASPVAAAPAQNRDLFRVLKKANIKLDAIRIIAIAPGSIEAPAHIRRWIGHRAIRMATDKQADLEKQSIRANSHVPKTPIAPKMALSAYAVVS